MSDAPNSWDRRKGERDKPWAAFQVYRDMGPDRGKLQTYRKVYGYGDEKVRTPGWFSNWTDTWEWKARAAAWDTYIDRKAQEGRAKGVDAEGQKLGAQWKVKRVELMDMSDRLIEKAKQMLDFPLAKVERTEETNDAGEAIAITTIRPARFTFATAAKMVETGAKLAAIAAEKSLDPRRYGIDEDEDAEEENTKRQKMMQAVLKDPEARKAMAVLAKKLPTPAPGGESEDDDE